MRIDLITEPSMLGASRLAALKALHNGYAGYWVEVLLLYYSPQLNHDINDMASTALCCEVCWSMARVLSYS
jgi:hypothetical protein